MPDSLLRDLLWYHDVQNEELLSALDWKFRKLETERHDARTERDQLKEALNNAMAMLDGSHRTIENLMAENSHLNTENERLREAIDQMGLALIREKEKRDV